MPHIRATHTYKLETLAISDDESCYTYDSVSYKTYEYESCHTYEQEIPISTRRSPFSTTSHVTHINQCHIPRINMSHITQVNKRHQRAQDARSIFDDESCQTYQSVLYHRYEYESCHTRKETHQLAQDARPFRRRAPRP